MLIVKQQGDTSLNWSKSGKFFSHFLMDLTHNVGPGFSVLTPPQSKIKDLLQYF